MRKFNFEVGCDYTPEFKSHYELIYKSNLLYMDEHGQGQSFRSNSEEGVEHNNVVTQSCEHTYKLMKAANRMGNKAMQKQTNNMAIDSKTMYYKPQFGVFYGQRLRYEEEEEVVGDRTKRRERQVTRTVIREYEDEGVIAFLKPKGNIMINNLFAQDADEIHSLHSNLTIGPISIDPTIYIESKKSIEKSLTNES